MSTVTDDEVEIAIAGLGFTAVAATTERWVSKKDLRTDMRSALENFLTYATIGNGNASLS